MCAHLTAHSHKLARRLADYDHIVRSLLFAPTPGAPRGARSTMYDSSHLFFFGDLNFRLDLPPAHALAHSAHSAPPVDVARALPGKHPPNALVMLSVLLTLVSWCPQSRSLPHPPSSPASTRGGQA